MVLENTNIIHSKFEGAWYKWFDLRNYKNQLYNINNSQELVDILGSQIGLIVVPGHCFGLDGLTFRLSIVDSNIYQGIKNMISWLESRSKHTYTSS